VDLRTTGRASFEIDSTTLVGFISLELAVLNNQRTDDVDGTSVIRKVKCVVISIEGACVDNDISNAFGPDGASFSSVGFKDRVMECHSAARPINTPSLRLKSRCQITRECAGIDCQRPAIHVDGAASCTTTCSRVTADLAAVDRNSGTAEGVQHSPIRSSSIARERAVENFQ
jgi:hypothetical protein